MAGHDKERDRGHDHRSNGSTVQAGGAELAQQGTEDPRRLSSFLGSTPVAPAILDDASALPQRDGGTGPALAGSAERRGPPGGVPSGPTNKSPATGGAKVDGVRHLASPVSPSLIKSQEPKVFCLTPDSIEQFFCKSAERGLR